MVLDEFFLSSEHKLGRDLRIDLWGTSLFNIGKWKRIRKETACEIGTNPGERYPRSQVKKKKKVSQKEGSPLCQMLLRFE